MQISYESERTRLCGGENKYFYSQKNRAWLFIIEQIAFTKLIFTDNIIITIYPKCANYHQIQSSHHQHNYMFIKIPQWSSLHKVPTLSFVSDAIAISAWRNNASHNCQRVSNWLQLVYWPWFRPYHSLRCGNTFNISLLLVLSCLHVLLRVFFLSFSDFYLHWYFFFSKSLFFPTSCIF